MRTRFQRVRLTVNCQPSTVESGADAPVQNMGNTNGSIHRRDIEGASGRKEKLSHALERDRSYEPKDGVLLEPP